MSSASGIQSNGLVTGAGAVSLSGGVSAFNAGANLQVAEIKISGATTQVEVYANLGFAKIWDQAAGTLTAAVGDKVSFSGVGDSFSGTLAGAGSIAFTGGSDALTGVSLTAASVIVSTATVTLAGAISNKSVVTVTTPNLMVAAAGATLGGGGSLNLTNTATNKITGVTAGATLTNATDKINGAGNIGGGSMVLVNQVGGVINGNQAGLLTIDTGAATILNAGLIENTGTGGTTIASAVANTGTLMVTKGVLTVNGRDLRAGTVKISGGAAFFVSAFSENVSFTSTTGVLELAKSQTYAGQVSGLSKTGTSSLDLRDIGFTAGTTTATFNGTATSGVLTVTDGTHTSKITLIGNYVGRTFTTSSDGQGGTMVVDPATPGGDVRLAPLVGAMAGFGSSAGAAPAHRLAETWPLSSIAMMARAP